MKVTSIIENTSRKGLPVEHGLSLYIEMESGVRVLFDMGQTSLFASNAKVLSLDIAAVDVAVVSHGHYDHGGGLRTFLEENKKHRCLYTRRPSYPTTRSGKRVYDTSVWM